MRRPFPIGCSLFVLFSAFTLLELWLLFLLTQATSLATTILIALATAILGSALAKHEGLAVLRRAQQDLANGRLPGAPMADALLILIGGAFLIAPGLITDLLGLTTLLAPCRAVYRKWLFKWFRAQFRMEPSPGGEAHGQQQAAPGTFRVHRMEGGEDRPYAPPPNGFRDASDNIVDVDYEEIDRGAKGHPPPQ